jgi:hypothetical protein
MNYFNKFPLINYNGHTAVNLLTRAQLSKSTKSDKTVFYPYTIRDYDRADNLSENYYDSPDYSWLIWMTNDMIDPYYDYPLSDDDFEAYVKDKYGSIAEANRKIKYYRTKWVNDEGVISPAQFESLDSRYKKYHDPVVDMDYGITGYKRRKADVTVNTNKVLQITLTNRTGEFVKGEEIYKQSNSAVYSECVHPVNYPVPEGQDAHIGLQHLVGTFVFGDIMVGKTSGATATVGTVTTIAETLATTEADYWESVSCYDFEYEINQKKKEIKLLDGRYRNQVESELQRVMDIQ